MCFDAYHRRYRSLPGASGVAARMGPVKMQRSSAFGARKALVLFVLLAFVQLGQAVTCPTCKDTIGGCTGGADCPLLKDPAANALTLAESLKYLESKIAGEALGSTTHE